jgi:type IV pilus assembly protein PilA
MVAVAATLLLAVPVSGCGNKKTNRAKAYSAPVAAQATGADTVEAKAAARKAATAVESCFVDSQDYSQCKSATVLSAAGVEAGTGPGQASVVAAGPNTYRIEAHSKAGGVFTVAKLDDGSMPRTCSGAGCEGGKW